ncbi:hypothetical protein G3M48_003372, partial [Beauveria asiatica]
RPVSLHARLGRGAHPRAHHPQRHRLVAGPAHHVLDALADARAPRVRLRPGHGRHEQPPGAPPLPDVRPGARRPARRRPRPRLAGAVRRRRGAARRRADRRGAGQGGAADEKRDVRAVCRRGSVRHDGGRRGRPGRR